MVGILLSFLDGIFLRGYVSFREGKRFDVSPCEGILALKRQLMDLVDFLLRLCSLVRAL